MSESDEESLVSVKRSNGPGEDIFGKYDPDKLVEDGPTDNSTDEDEEDTEDEEEDEEDDEEDEEEEEEDEEEQDVPRNIKRHTIRPSEYSSRLFTRHIQRNCGGNFDRTSK